jgi:hypothetical protein
MPKFRCKALKSGELKIEFLPTTRTQNNLVTYVGEALNLYGPKNLFIAINPYMDFQPEFLDHVCLNTIRGFQVFFPIPFVEFKRFSPRSDNKTNSGRVFPNSNHINTISQPYFSDELHLNNNSSSFEISKNYGFFDTTDFTVAAFYGSDFLALRSDQQKCSDLTNCFLSQNGLHVLRSVEPSLRIPYHNVNCTLLYGNRSSLLLERCLKHKRWKMGTRAQLANLFFSL